MPGSVERMRAGRPRQGERGADGGDVGWDPTSATGVARRYPRSKTGLRGFWERRTTEYGPRTWTLGH
ncbi:hypothetical protein BU14_0159s0037 [Porphyra umbilicalis]|uniref:Uncharacterized protein n=1 Tax=Porphyra umbilicalis TaxID=2786 RepID=A0A1X6P8G5_PORUM|nr:hypothetical protein BU14_0159s0037 [Porphyra umbilicalis]|eukprot:OSX77182.1 hypothetical protein BU14_0159s0037 [Porphyra umbilicalis]